jgi:hypothetical protein
LGAGVPGDLLKTSIPLFNSGDRDLHIRSITASCGCAGVELSRKTIPPGESGQLTISARLRNDHERVSFEIQFQDDDPTSPHALWASADTLPILRTDVHQLDFYYVAEGQTPSRTIKVSRADRSPWPFNEPIDVVAERNFVVVRPEPATLKGSQENQLQLKVTLQPGLKGGSTSDRLVLKPKNSPRSAMVPITITIVPRILVAPRHLDFGNTDDATGPPVTRYVIIKRFDGKKLESPIKSVCPPGIEVKDETPAAVPSLDVRKFRIVYHPRESVKPLGKDHAIQSYLVRTGGAVAGCCCICRPQGALCARTSAGQLCLQ